MCCSYVLKMNLLKSSNTTLSSDNLASRDIIYTDVSFSQMDVIIHTQKVKSKLSVLTAICAYQVTTQTIQYTNPLFPE